MSRGSAGPDPKPWATPRRVRIVLSAAIGALLGVVAGGIFDRVEWELVAVGPVVASVALLVASRRWPVRLVASTLAVIGTVVVAASVAGGSIGDAGRGLIEGPRRLVTTEWPSPTDAGVIASIAALLAAVTAATAELAGRERAHLAPLVPVAAGFTALVSLGAPLKPATLLLVVLGLAAIALALIPHGEIVSTRTRTLLGERTLIVSGVAIIAVAVAASSTLAWADRANPRRTEDAELTVALLDPIEAMVALRSTSPAFDLVLVTDRSTLIGQSVPARWRVAALDEYDGQRWVPRLTLRPIGGRLGLPSPPAPDRPPPIRYDVEFVVDDLDLVPFPGRPLSVDADVETDLDRVAVRLADRPRPGSVVEALSEIAPNAAAAQTAVLSTRQVDEIAASFSELATNLAGDGTVLEQIRRIEERMQSEWQLDGGAPGGGQQLALIERFMTDTRRGTEEQFVTAFVLLVRSLGFDARVATGFVVPPDELDTPLPLSSSHAGVWPEVQLEGLGWLAFDPAPSTETADDDAPPPPPEAQSPAAAQPPIAPPADDANEDDEVVIDSDDSGDGWGSIGRWSKRVSVGAAITVLPLLGIVAAILVAKLLRRRRRLAAADPALLIRGAWANATDSLIDAGLSVAPAWTDDRIALNAVALASNAPHEMRRLAAMSTAMTFGATDDGWRLADDAKLTANAIDEAIRADRTRWQRVRWRMSMRSFRRSTRSPIAP